jgi:molecular chaperone GrpE (heat shock protein)
MMNWLKRVLGGATVQVVEDVPAGSPDLEREVQRLRLDLAEERARVEQLQRALERQRDEAGVYADAREEALLAAVAVPVTQLLTQAHLVELEGRAVETRDVLTVARRLVRALEDAGLRVEGEIGAQVPFDPDHHALLSATARPRRGEPVVVRFAGVSYAGKVLRKAGVEPASDPERA